MAQEARTARDDIYNEMSRAEEQRRQEGGWGNWFKNGASIVGKNVLYGFSTLGAGLMDTPGQVVNKVADYTNRDFFLQLMEKLHHTIKSLFL